MNTFEKGDGFEEEIYQLFRIQIEEDRFWARKEFCQIFRQKGYYSRDRDKEIKFDVSIEITLPGMPSYSIVVLIECKNYSGTIPVDDIEEFREKVRQVSGANVKGVFASKSAFQEGAIKYAKSNGLGLLRKFDNRYFKYILPRPPSTFAHSYLQTSLSLQSALSEEAFISKYFDICCVARETYSHSVNDMFEQLFLGGNSSLSVRNIAVLGNPKRKSLGVVKYRPKEEIEELATSSLHRISYRYGMVDLYQICEWQQRERGLIVETGINLSHRGDALGSLSFTPPRITIFRTDRQQLERVRFTLAHEIGHLVLGHEKYMLSE